MCFKILLLGWYNVVKLDKTFPKSVMDAMKAANKKLLAEKVKGHPLLKEILDSQAAYQKKSREWTMMSDYTYLKDNL